jgi:hypothetical protein
MVATTWSDLVQPVLRDGLPVVRRDDRHLQVGLDAPHRLVLEEAPGLYEALSHLDRRPPAELRPVVDRLVHDGWVVEGSRGSSSAPREAQVALTVDPLLADRAALACATAGLTRADDARLRLVATLGEPRRRLADSLVRDDISHLWVAVLPFEVRLGPFVTPGRTPCLRCIDAHLGDIDPRRATVLHQLEERPVAPLTDPDPCLVQLGLAWAARDLARAHEGRRPALRSATVTVTRDLDVTHRDWLRHAHCGCAWG